MSFFSGLNGYEHVLMLLGVILFAASVFALLYQTLHQRSIVPLSVPLLISLTMVGYPSIQQIQYKDGLVTITKDTETLQKDPTNVVARQSLQQNLDRFAPRTLSSNNADNVATVAAAQFALGSNAVQASLSKALTLDPGAPAAVALKQRITLVDQLAELTSAAQARPDDAPTQKALISSVAQASAIHLANPDAILQLARAQLALGQHEQARVNTEKVLAIQPDSVAAQSLTQQIATRVPPPRS